MWKPVPNYEGLYEVSKDGRVRALPREGADGRNLSGGELDGHISNYGYRRVHLSKNGKSTKYGVHQLVALAFLGEPESGEQVNHKDGDKLHNHAKNLEWVTPAENTEHADNNGLRNISGENSPHSKLSSSQVEEIRARYAEGETQTSISKDFPVSQPQVSQIVRRVQWS